MAHKLEPITRTVPSWHGLDNLKIQAGDKFESFYGNGTPIGTDTITRVTKSSIFYITTDGIKTWPEKYAARTTVQGWINKGMWKQIL